MGKLLQEGSVHLRRILSVAGPISWLLEYVLQRVRNTAHGGEVLPMAAGLSGRCIPDARDTSSNSSGRPCDVL